MATDIRRHTAPAGNETPRRQAINDLSLTVNDIVYVANATDRAQFVAGLTTAGVGPSASRPIYVHRGDATPGWELEFTTNGTTWNKVRGAAVQGQPNGAVIQAWSLAATTSGAGGVTVTFPEAFATSVLSAVATVADASPTTVGFVRIEGFSGSNRTNFVARVYSLTGAPVLNAAVRLNCVAVGY